MKIIVGLGNPGKEYDNTRHNVGFMILDSYLGNVKWSNKFNSLYYDNFVGSEKVIFIKPQTFMNNSGSAVLEFVNYYNISMNDLLIIHDDLDLKLGTYKLKVNSSSAGHNGIKSIINNLGTQNFSRLKVGIGNNKDDVYNYVLGKFSKKEMQILNNEFLILHDIIDSFISSGIDKTMNIYNSK